MNAKAHAEATDYLAKAGSGACKSLADATEADVKNNIKAEQDILNKIDKGAKCPNGTTGRELDEDQTRQR